MPKTSKPTKVRDSVLNGVPVEVYTLTAKTKDSNDKEIVFPYEFQSFGEGVTIEQLQDALKYKDSKGVEYSGLSVLRDYANTAIKNAARSSKLAETVGVLKMREDPEAAIKTLIEQMVLVHGVPREVAERAIRATVQTGTLAKEKAASQETAGQETA